MMFLLRDNERISRTEVYCFSGGELSSSIKSDDSDHIFT